MEGLWQWTVGERVLAKTPEYPGFQELLDVLTEHTKSFLVEHPVNLTPETTGDQDNEAAYLLTDLLKELTTLDTRWRYHKLQKRDLKRSAELLSLIQFELMDYQEIGDLVAAKALAALALAQVVTGDPLTRAEAILAVGMEYPGHAEGQARLLPESDPLRHFLLKEDARLERAGTRAQRFDRSEIPLVAALGSAERRG